MIITMCDEFLELSNLLYIDTPALLEVILYISSIDKQIDILEITDEYDINLLLKINNKLSNYKHMKIVKVVDVGIMPKRFKLKKVNRIKDEI